MSKTVPIRKAIFDSGPLFLALTLNYTLENNISNYNDYLRKAYQNIIDIPKPSVTLKLFFDNIKFIYSTTHIIGEVIGLVKSRLKLKSNYEDKFWECSIKYLAGKSFSEELISIVEFYKEDDYKELIFKIGFPDSELIKFAKSMKNIPIISLDRRTLKEEASKKNIEVLILQDEIHNYYL